MPFSKQLCAELVDSNCLGLYVPEESTLIANDGSLQELTEDGVVVDEKSQLHSLARKTNVSNCSRSMGPTAGPTAPNVGNRHVDSDSESRSE